MTKNLTRRSFLAGGAAAAAAGALGMAGCSSESLASTGNGGNDVASIEWEDEADVIVIGYGGAGASAAIGAADEGASVIILEKAPEELAGGNTSVCGGGILFSDPDKQDEAYEFIKYQVPDYTVDDEEIRAFCMECATLADWLEDHGATIQWDEHPRNLYQKLPSAVGFPRSGTIGGTGAGIFKFWNEVMDGLGGIKIMYEMGGHKLVFDPTTKEVFGVIALDAEGNQHYFKAKRGVCLCCGGFEANPEMLSSYYPPRISIFPGGTPYNTGDGITMAAELGAKMRHFSSVEWSGQCCLKGSQEIGVSLGNHWGDLNANSNAIVVNDRGLRFMDEAASISPEFNCLHPSHEKNAMPELEFSNIDFRYVNLPFFLICDSTQADAGPIFNACGKDAGNHFANVKGLYSWSDDNQAEVEKGWVEKADTLEELAEKLGIDPQGLVDQVARYNEFVANGEDLEFGRNPERLTPVDNPPYYGTELAFALYNTQGGPARDGEHHVITYDNEIIPRLYSAGELGSLYGWLYQGCGNVPEALAGRVAGANAAHEEPWD